MGAASSNQQRGAIQQQQRRGGAGRGGSRSVTSQQVAVPQHLMTGHGRGGGPALNVVPTRVGGPVQPPAAAGGGAAAPTGMVSEAKNVKNFCTVEEDTVKFDKESGVLSFTTNTTTECQLEVHVAVRVDIVSDTAMITPNHQKAPPRAVTVAASSDKTHSHKLNLDGVSDYEKRYVAEYRRQCPVIIQLRYTVPDGETGTGKQQLEYTVVQLEPTCKVVVRLLQTDAGVFKEEQLFGAEEAGDKSPGAPGDSGEVAEGGVIEVDDDDATCVICLTNDKTTAVIPCRHMCMCRDCAEELRRRSAKCPVCRGPIHQLVAIKS